MSAAARVAPSTNAASSSSRGSALKKPISSHVQKGTGKRRVRQHERGEAVGGAELGQHAIERDEQQRRGHEVEDEDQRGKGLATRKAQPRDGIARQTGDDRGDERDEDRRDQAVAQPQRKARSRPQHGVVPVSYTHLRAHETGRNLVCRLLLEKKK